jgi:hypothetical protein
MTGAAGEYHVAAELSRREWLATVTIKNSPDTDVLAQRPETERLVAIQTKTASPGNHFRLKDKNEAPAKREGQWFVLVALQGAEERPRFYVIPRDHVAAMVFAEHADWLATPGRGGKAHNPNEQRNLTEADIAGYLDRWDLLDQNTGSVLFLGDPRFLALCEKHGLPGGHPGLS